MKIYRVNMSEMKLAVPGVRLSATVGSCIALCVYDKSNPLGAMVHIVLPSNPRDQPIPKNSVYKYAETGIPAMVDELTGKGARRLNLVAKVAGGANMFPGIKTQIENLKIGQRNIDETKSILRKMNILIMGQDLGGNSGRRIEFDIHSRKMMTATINGDIRYI